MSWFDDLLKTATEKQGPKEITMGKILDGDVTFSDNDGGIRDDDGNLVGDIQMRLLDDTLSPVWRLKIPENRWNKIDIVCDGNALDITTEPMSDDRYKVKRTLRGFKPTTVVEESELELREFGATKEFVNWIETLGTDEIEALRQIYYDRWCFDTASQRDRMYYELLEEEKKGRV